ncbi:hypothetical protein Lal_00026179 [Lupinus albus]|nr:hypothetical protein Lal_00026179 [Lupinus albus]
MPLTSKIGCGGLIRNHSDNWLCGFSSVEGVDDVFLAELLGVIKAFNLAKECEKSDDLDVVDYLAYRGSITLHVHATGMHTENDAYGAHAGRNAHGHTEKNSVMDSGHVASDAENKEVRKGKVRERNGSTVGLRDFINTIKSLSGYFLLESIDNQGYCYIGAFIDSLMAENTRLKDLAAEVKRISDALDLQIAQSDQRDNQNMARFNRLDHSLSSLTAGMDNLMLNMDAIRNAALGTSSGNQTHNGNRNSFPARAMKLDFPKFDGTNTLNWIFKANQFFEYYNTPDLDRIMIATVHMEGDVIPWFQLLHKHTPFQTWHTLVEAIESHFGPSLFDCPRSMLFKLTQTFSVAQYHTEFTNLANRVIGVSDDALLDCFISGLKDDIRREVIVQSPPSLVRAVALAKLYEEKYQPQTQTPRVRPNFTTYTNHYQKQPTPTVPPKPPNTLPPLLPTPTIKPNTYQKPALIKRMSAAEMQIRREKGLCFTCDEKFS